MLTQEEKDLRGKSTKSHGNPEVGYGATSIKVFTIKMELR